MAVVCLNSLFKNMRKAATDKPDTTGLRQIFSNTSWIVLERAIRLGIGFFVAVWVARYLGPSQYGVLSFGLAWVALFSAFGKLGLENIVVRDIVSDRGSEVEILGTATALRLIGGLIVVIGSTVLYGVFYSFDNQTQLAVIALMGLAQLFLAAEVIDWWFRSRVEWRYVFRARIIAFIISTIGMIICLFSGLGVIWIAAITLLDAIMVASFLIIEWLRHSERGRQWKAGIARARALLSDSWPAILSGLAIMIYMRIDQIMIGSMMTEADVGIYSVAVKLSEVWYVIPLAVTQSVMPGIVSARKAQNGSYEQKLIWLIALLFWSSFLVAILVTFTGPALVTLLFGHEYRLAGDVLRIHFWAGIFVALGVGISQWYLAENRLRISLYGTIAGALINLLMNLLLIPEFGITGAALSTVGSYFVSAYLSALFFPSAAPAWRIVNRAIFMPFQRV